MDGIDPADAAVAANTTQLPSAQRDRTPWVRSLAESVMSVPSGVDESRAPVAELTSSRNSGAALEQIASEDGHRTPSPMRSARRLEGEKVCAPVTALQVVLSADAEYRSGHADGEGEPAGQ